MNGQVKDIVRCAVMLFIITAVVSASLAGFHMLTADAIDQNEVKTEQRALSEVFPQADVTEKLLNTAAEYYRVNAIYAAKKDGAVIGYCIKVTESGYGGKIQSIVGVDMNGKVTGVSVISNSETAGLGANIKNESFRSQFVGKGEVSVVKAGAGDNEIDALSGATISSKAMAASVNRAVEAAQGLMNGDNNLLCGFGGTLDDVEL